MVEHGTVEFVVIPGSPVRFRLIGLFILLKKMDTKVQLHEKNKYLARKLTAEWLKNAYFRKNHELGITEIVDSETRKVEKLTFTL